MKSPSKNSILQSAIIDIMDDGKERNVESIIFLLEVSYNLHLDKDYQKFHFNNAVALLKKDGYLKSAGHGKYIKNFEADDPVSDLTVEVEMNSEKEKVEARAEKSEEASNGFAKKNIRNADVAWKLLNKHHQECIFLLKSYDLSKANEADLKEITDLINYKNYLEDKILKHVEK